MKNLDIIRQKWLKSIDLADYKHVLGFGKHHWIWYDFKTVQPRCELTPPPADRYIPYVFRQHTASSKVASNSQSHGAGITLSSPSFRGGVQDDKGFASGEEMSDDFKRWLSRLFISSIYS